MALPSTRSIEARLKHAQAVIESRYSGAAVARMWEAVLDDVRTGRKSRLQAVLPYCTTSG